MIVAGVLLAASVVYQLLCVASALSWRRRKRAATNVDFAPSVAILKPLCGFDPELRENLRSFCRQDYPSFRVVFGALDPEDPALAEAEAVQHEFPDRDIRIVRGGEPAGLNRKVATLLALQSLAETEILVLADSDMRVEPDYLRRVVAPFEDPATGLVTCPYRGSGARGIASRIEALGIGADFIPSVFLADRLQGMAFAFGATIAVRRDMLQEIGGFDSLKDELADDYLLGARVAASGRRVVLSDVVVESVLGREPMRDMLVRRLRWMRTVRVMRPAGYLGLVFAQTTAISVLALAVSGCSLTGWWMLAGGVACRMLAATGIARFCTVDDILPRLAWLLPAADLTSSGIWACGLFGKTVEWRGRKFRLQPGGRLEPIADRQST